MAIVELKKQSHIFVCLPLLVLLLVPAAAVAAVVGILVMVVLMLPSCAHVCT